MKYVYNFSHIKRCNNNNTQSCTINRCSNKEMKMVVVVMFSYQGDNIKESVQFADHVDSWLLLRDTSVSLGIITVLCNQSSFWFSWQEKVKEKKGEITFSCIIAIILFCFSFYRVEPSSFVGLDVRWTITSLFVLNSQIFCISILTTAHA